MVKRVYVDGYNGFKEAIAHFTSPTSPPVYVLFAAPKEFLTGKSWCPDCTAAEPIIEEALKGAPKDGIFIFCSVGSLSQWMDPSNEFRRDDILRLRRIPTLIKWNTFRRLEEEQCKSAALVTMLFED